MAETRKNLKSGSTSTAEMNPIPGNTVEKKANGNGNGENGNGKLRFKSLIIDGTKYRTQLNHKFETRKPWENYNPKKITSDIPGTILKIDVKVGQVVKAGEQMLVLEAMKMKNKILFHHAGTVKKIHVKEGEKVPKDTLMVEMK